MKHNWEYKKLGEVVSSINGLWTGKKEPFVTIPVISLKNFTKDCKLKKEEYSIIDVEVRQFASRKLQYGDIIIEKSGGSDTQPVGRPILFDIKEGDYSFSNFTATLRVNDANKESLNSLFLHNVLLAYYKQGKTLSLQSKTTGIHNLDLKSYLRLPIPLPPLSTQQSIVSELDSLSKIIADCKETLKDYDALEQSIFYDMFGDPVKNDKGWEVKKLGEVCSKITDGTHSSPENTSEGDRMYITAKNIKKDGIELKNITYVSEEVHRSIYDRCNPEYGDVLYIKDGITTGIATINTLNEEFTLLSSVALIKVGNNLNNYFLKGLMNFESFYEMVRGNMGGAAITRLTLAKINNITIIFPPLPLQQQFASKIEAIEQMKEETKKALQEAETLFQARMDYWFN